VSRWSIHLAFVRRRIVGYSDYKQEEFLSDISPKHSFGIRFQCETQCWNNIASNVADNVAPAFASIGGSYNTTPKQ